MSARPITDTLRHIGGGVFIDTASDKLAELVAARREVAGETDECCDGVGYCREHNPGGRLA